MKIKLLALHLQTQKTREVIDFSPQISFFHGQISAGKSSIARLIDFCLGGDLERTPAITQELVSVALAAQIAEYEVLLEREAHGSNQIQVSWKNPSGEAASTLAPLQASTTPIWEEDIYNLSDLIFYLAGITPIKVRRGRHDSESPLVRLSFRDLMWYCYLEQDHLDSSFFRLEDVHRGRKSRDVMRFVLGYYTEQLNSLEIRLEEVREKRFGKIEAIKQIRKFLEQFNYGSESEIMIEIEGTKQELTNARKELAAVRAGHTSDTHFTDDLRTALRELSTQLGQEENTEQELRAKLDEQQSLRAELLSAKFKLARKESASAVLSGVIFEYCPACGTKVDSPKETDSDTCYLCHQHPVVAQGDSAPQSEIVRRDLTARITDLDESIKRHKKAHLQQERLITDLRARKARLDNRLNEEMKHYDSIFLAHSRELERRVATLEERVDSLEKMVKLPEAIVRLEEEADALGIEEKSIRRRIQEEKDNLTGADRNIREIEESYLEALLAVGVPGVKPGDEVELNRTTWIPSILPSGDEVLAWDFYNAGSGGKKTLLNVCYALAVHKVAAKYNLPLPTFLVIDTPMKNIGEEVNHDIFVSFYKYLYDLADGLLRETQFIIVDKEYIAPPSSLHIFERYMTPNEKEHPPLIPYYQGP